MLIKYITHFIFQDTKMTFRFRRERVSAILCDNCVISPEVHLWKSLKSNQMFSTPVSS